MGATHRITTLGHLTHAARKHTISAGRVDGGRCMPVVAVINYKGGVGKTTTTANLAAELAWRGRNVPVMDLDAQASLTFSFIPPDRWSRDLEHGATIKAWFDSFDDGRPVELGSLLLQPSAIRTRLRDSGNGGELHLVPSHSSTCLSRQSPTICRRWGSTT